MNNDTIRHTPPSRTKHLLMAIAVAALQGVAIAPPAAAQQRTDAFITPQDVVDLVAEARQRLTQGDPQGALQDFESALARDPNNPQVLYFLGNLYLQLNQVDQGLSYLARSVELSPQNPRLRLVLAKAYERFGQPDAAMREYQQIMRISPGSPEAREAEERNRTLAEQRRVDQAAEEISRADITALTAEGRRLLEKRDSAGALRIFKSVLAHDPDNVEILYFAGNLHLSIEQPVPGIEYLERAVTLAPGLIRLRFTLAQAYERHGLPNEALHQLQQIAAADPGSAEGQAAQNHIPTLRERIRQQQQAESIPSLDSVALETEGRRLLAARDTEGALRAFKALLMHKPDDVEILYFTGNLQLTMNQTVAGIKRLERAVSLAPDLARLRLTLAQAYERYDAIESAMREYHAINANSPNTPEGQEAAERERALAGRMSRLRDDAIILSAPPQTLIAEGNRLFSQGDPLGTLRMFQAVLIRDPENVEALYLASNVYRSMNRPQETIAYLQRSVELMPDNHAMRMELAQTYEQFGLMGDAMREYRILTERSPQGDIRLAAEQRLRMLTARRALSEETPDLAQATRLFSEVLRDFPDDHLLYSEAVTTLLEGGYIEDTSRMLQTLIAEQPNQPLAYLFLADTHLLSGDMPGAITQYQSALKLFSGDDPRLQSVTIRLANLQGLYGLQQNDFVSARKHFEEILAIVPNDHGARLNLAASQHGLGETDAAERILLDMITEDDNDLDARIRLGVIYYESQRLEESAREFEEIMIRGRGTPAANQANQLLAAIYGGEDGAAIRANVQDRLIEQLRTETNADPDNLQAWSRLAMLLIQMNRQTDAIEAIEQMVRLNPENLQTQEGLADLYEQTNALDKAIKVYEDILQLTQDEEIITRITEKSTLASGKLAFNEGKRALAEEHFKSAIEQNPNNFVAYFYLAIQYGEDERFLESAHAYEQVVRVVPNHAAAHLSLGVIYEQISREEDAVNEYRTAIRLAPTETLRKGATDRLAALEKRMAGFSYSLNYSTSYSSNNNLTAEDPVGELRSDLSSSINYRRKLYQRPIYLGFIFSPSYSIYHRSQFDLINLSYSPYLTFKWKGVDFSATVTRSEMESLATEAAVNSSDSFTGDISGSFRMRALLPWLGNAEQRRLASSSWRLTFNARRFESATSPIFSSLNRSLSATLNQTLGNGWRWTGGYNFVDNHNLERLIGTDFAYQSHGFNLQLNKQLASRLMAIGSYSFSLLKYKNPDSATLFTRYRENTSHNFSAGVHYFPLGGLRLFANLSYQVNESNLPTGFILSPEDVGTAIGLQSTSLGDYQNFILSTGVAVNF